MSDLYPTPTRLRLLRAVAAGRVLEGLTEETEGHTWDTADAESGYAAQKVTARVDELARAGWVFIGADYVTWELTAAGRDVLDGAT